jgi:plastocyanin
MPQRAAGFDNVQEISLNVGPDVKRRPEQAQTEEVHSHMTARITVLALLAYWSVQTAVAAVTHNVSVRNNFFEPNDLTIEVGDTVRWTNSSGFHDVTADDGSWASETSSSWTYERTFNSVEEVRYYCTVHSTPGQNINTRMNGRINVVQADGPGFLVNPGLSDAWFNPLTDGQGFFIIVWEDIQNIFLSWFTYDTERPPGDVTAHLGEPGHRWLTALGPYDGDSIGTITIVWTGCNAGLLSYDLPDLDLMGDIPIERIVLDNVPACEAAQGSQAQGEAAPSVD